MLLVFGVEGFGFGKMLGPGFLMGNKGVPAPFQQGRHIVLVFFEECFMDVDT